MKLNKKNTIKPNKKHIVLKTSNLSIGYVSRKQRKIVASNINLSIEKGKFIAILGKNGIGKSTLLRTISKVQKPIEGAVYINNKNLNDIAGKKLATSLSLVLTDRLPESQLTVFEIVGLGRQPYTNWIDKLSNEDYKKVYWAMKMTGVEHLKNDLFYELSDGQLQRVLIARALAQDTEIIILDEPTAHLDIHHSIKVFSLLKELIKTTQKTIIVSTHQVNLAIQLADELVLLSAERNYSGTVTELIKEDAFLSLFPSEMVKFNTRLKQFVIHKTN